MTTTEMLMAELAAVTPPLCGWTQPGDAEFVCQRAQGHIGAQVVIDAHVALINGELVMAS